MSDLDQWIFIYRDSDSPLAADNIFFSLPYKKVSQFKKDNPGFSPVVSYGFEHLLEEWGVLSRLKQLESEKAALTQELHDYKKELDKYIKAHGVELIAKAALGKKLKIAVEALRVVTDGLGSYEGWYADVAKEALARIEHGEKPDGILKKK